MINDQHSRLLGQMLSKLITSNVALPVYQYFHLKQCFHKTDQSLKNDQSGRLFGQGPKRNSLQVILYLPVNGDFHHKQNNHKTGLLMKTVQSCWLFGQMLKWNSFPVML